MFVSQLMLSMTPELESFAVSTSNMSMLGIEKVTYEIKFLELLLT